MNISALHPSMAGGPWREPLCTRLFALAPCGLRSGLHESLPSYLDRLARLHSVPDGPFLLNEVHPKPVPSSGSLLGRQSARLLVGNGYAQRTASAVARLTGVGEVAGLVQPLLSEHLSWYKNTRRCAAWCPRCFCDWTKNSLPVYRPLLWSLASVRTCPVHNVRLEECCPRCSREFNHFGLSGWSLMCPDCGYLLSERVTDSDTDAGKRASDYAGFSASQVRDLLSWGLRCSGSDLVPGCFATNVSNAIAALGNEYVLAQLTGLSRPVIQKWRHGHGRPQLPALLRLGSCFNVPLSDWLSQQIPASAFARRTRIPRELSVFQTYDRHPSRNAITQAVSAYLTSPRNEPLSVRELAEAIGTSPRRLYGVCPNLIRQVVARRARAVTRRKVFGERERVRMVRQAIAEVRASGGRVSRHAVLVLVRSRGVKCSWLLKEIFRNEVRLSAHADRHEIPLRAA